MNSELEESKAKLDESKTRISSLESNLCESESKLSNSLKLAQEREEKIVILYNINFQILSKSNRVIITQNQLNSEIDGLRKEIELKEESLKQLNQTIESKNSEFSEWQTKNNESNEKIANLEQQIVKYTYKKY